MNDPRFDALVKSMAGDGQSRRAALRLAAGALAALVARARPAAGVAQACRENGAKCTVFTDCCSRRCQGGRCEQGRARPGAGCDRDAECRSGICGRISSVGSICRDADCRRAGRPCADTTDCCRGVCSSSTFRCVD